MKLLLCVQFGKQKNNRTYCALSCGGVDTLHTHASMFAFMS